MVAVRWETWRIANRSVDAVTATHKVLCSLAPAYSHDTPHHPDHTPLPLQLPVQLQALLKLHRPRVPQHHIQTLPSP